MFSKTVLTALAAAVIATAALGTSSASASDFGFEVRPVHSGNGYGWKGKGYGHKNYGHKGYGHKGYGYGKGWGYKKCRDVPVYGWNYYGKKVIVGYDRICR